MCEQRHRSQPATQAPDTPTNVSDSTVAVLPQRAARTPSLADTATKLPDWVAPTMTMEEGSGSSSGGTSVGESSSSITAGHGFFDNIARMIADVADALGYAHSHNVVHRDTKPSNLLLSPDGRVAGMGNLSEGCYLLRTNLADWTAKDLWKTYIQLTQAEAAFRTQKSELNLHPIWHHKEDRVQARILFSFQAYAPWKRLELWMSRCGLGNGPRPLIEEFERIKTNDIVLPTANGRAIRIRCVTQLDESRRILLGRLGLTIPTRLGEPQWSSESQR